MNFVKIVFLITCLMFVTGVSNSNPKTCNGFADPGLVYHAYVDAVTKGDWKLAFLYIEPNKRAKIYKETIFGLIVASSFDEKLGKGLDQIFRDKGFTINSKNQYIDLENDIKKIDDWPGLMKEVAIFMEKYNGMKFASKDIALTDIKIKNDSASGSLKLNDSNKTKTVLFTKTGSGWCLTTMD